MMQEACVLMSTYNGGKYVKEQIDSILSQDYDGAILILIRDDGSTDDTLNIIRSISCPDNREIQMLEAENNLGPQRSFLTLIEKAPKAEYYFFADQDDVWKSDHVQSAVDMLRKSDVPALYCSNYSLVDSNLKMLSQYEITEKPRFTPLKSLFYNQIPGCCMAWNEKLHKYLIQMHPENVMMHDSYVLSFACFVGEVLYDPESYILHRIHGGNVIGTGHKKIRPLKWFSEKVRLIVRKEDYDISEMAAEFLKACSTNSHKEYLQDVQLLETYKRSSRLTMRLLNHPDTKETLDRTTISIRAKILLHLF